MRFWDSSAVVTLLIREAASVRLNGMSRDRSEAVVWWGTLAECESAIARRVREGRPDTTAIEHAREELSRLASMWTEVLPSNELRDATCELLQSHPLRAADAFQLAAAMVAAAGQPQDLPFVCLDVRLAAAAAAEGFDIVS